MVLYPEAYGVGVVWGERGFYKAEAAIEGRVSLAD